MPAKLTTTLSKIMLVPNKTNSAIIEEFRVYMKAKGSSEQHQNNNLKVAIGKQYEIMLMKYEQKHLKDSPAVLAFAACPAMCAAMGGAMWLSRRFSKRKNQTQVQEPVANPKQETAAATRTESMESQQQINYSQKRRKGKAATQDTSATSG